MRKTTHPRQGIASAWLLVMIVLVTAVSALVASEILKSRELASGRECELRAEWLARGALEYGLRKLGDAPKAGSAELPMEGLPDGKASVAWQPGHDGAWILRAEAAAGEPHALKNRAFTMPANRKAGLWVPSGPVQRVAGLATR